CRGRLCRARALARKDPLRGPHAHAAPRVWCAGTVAVKLWRRAWPALVLAGWAAAACAHKPSDAYLTVTVPPSGGMLQGEWHIALRDLDFVLGLDTNHDGVITWGELKTARSRIADYAFA